MPELPEVETIRLQLAKNLIGLIITEIEVLSPKSFQADKKDLIGRKILEVDRVAKVTLLKLDKDLNLAIHLKMTGQLIYRKKKEAGPCKENCGRYDVSTLPNKYTRVILKFNNGASLYFNDLRKFGWLKILKDNELRIMRQGYGPEPLDKEFTDEYLKTIFSKTSKPIKLVLLDQEKIAGIGNIYANEALFLAGILPTRKAKTLNNKEIKFLRESIIKVLSQAIKKSGTSDKDEAYRQLDGTKGQFQNYLLVYGKEGEKCPDGKGIIKKIKIGGRGTYYCPACQK